MQEPHTIMMLGMIGLVVAGLLGYLIGSIPFGLVLTRLAGHGDIRDIGSGNIGATNVLRTGSKALAAATLALDLAKGAAGAMAGLFVAGSGGLIAGGALAFVGHCYPVWLRFKGGKGVATFIGVLLAWAPIIAVGVCLVWLVTALLSRFSSLAALVASVAAIAIAWWTGQSLAMLVVLCAIVLLLYWRHRENIARLRAGTESRIGQTSS